MPVAISFPDAVNSAASFLNDPVRGDSASHTAEAGDACETCSAPKKGGQKDRDFDAVLALLIGGGVLPQPTAAAQATAVQPSAVTTQQTAAMTSVDTESSADGTSTSAGAGQATMQPGVSAPQEKTASTSSTRMASKLPEDLARPNIVHTGNIDGAHRTQQAAGTKIAAVGTLNGTAASVVIDAKDGMAAPEATQSALAGAPQQVTDDSEFVQTFTSDLATARPLSRDMLNALERIGRPPAVTGPIVSAVQLTRPASAAPTSLEPTTSMTHTSVVATPAAIAADPTVPAATVPAATVPAATVPAATIPGPTSTTSIITPPTLPTRTLPTAALVASIAENAPTTKLPTSVSRGSTSDTVSTPQSRKLSSAEGSVLSGNAASVPSLKQALSVATPILDPAFALEDFEPFAETAKSLSSSGIESLTSDLLTSHTSSTGQSTAGLNAGTAVSGVLSSVTNPFPTLAAPVSSEMRQPLTSQVSQSIMDHIERNGVRQGDSLSVRLDPPELGEMTFELSKTHEGLAIRVTASESITMDMLLVRGQEIESHLRGQQVNLKSLEFTQSSQNGGHSHGRQQNDESRESRNPLNQSRRDSGGLSSSGNRQLQLAKPDSSYGLSFRA